MMGHLNSFYSSSVNLGVLWLVSLLYRALQDYRIAESYAREAGPELSTPPAQSPFNSFRFDRRVFDGGVVLTAGELLTKGPAGAASALAKMALKATPLGGFTFRSASGLRYATELIKQYFYNKY